MDNPSQVSTRTKARVRTQIWSGAWDHFLAMEPFCRTLYAGLQKSYPGPLVVSVDRLPKSLNAQYTRGTRRKGQAYDLDPEIKAFRDEMFLRLGHQRSTWNKGGLLVAIVVFHSPKWLTKELTVRKMDADNKVKAVFDAFEKATGICDSRIWQHFVFKSYAKETRTTLVVFDTGDIVEQVVFR